MFIVRDMQSEVQEALAAYPIVVLTGPRQSGKTTLAEITTNKPIYSLESPDNRALAQQDPRLFLNRFEEQGGIIDEFQRVPELASYLQEIVDRKRENGMFLLTGSNNFLLMEKISQSLAGRAAILKLLPLSLKELKSTGRELDTDTLLYSGFYPAIHAENRNPTKAYNYYYETYIERDVRQLINIQNLHLFQRFISLCAGRIGQLLNYSELANETGVSVKTVQEWISVLEASYLIYLLPPYFANINKRIVKAPKLYFYDVGLAAYLLGIENVSHIKNHPLRGALFENMVVSEYFKHRFNQGLPANAYFYRDNHKNEVDLVFQRGINYTLVEIKSAQTYHPSFTKNPEKVANYLKSGQIQKMVVYDGEQEWANDDLRIVNFRNMTF